MPREFHASKIDRDHATTRQCGSEAYLAPSRKTHPAMRTDKRLALIIPARVAGAVLALLGWVIGTSVSAAEITVWAWTPEFNGAIMKEAAARYAARHPGTRVKVVDMPKNDLQQQLRTLLASGESTRLPDIVLIEDYYAQKYLLSFPLAFEPLSGKVNYPGFARYKIDLMRANGRLYGMPFDAGVTGLFYRRDLLARAGFTPQDLEDISWDRFIEIGQKVLSKTGKKMMVLAPTDLTLIHLMMQSAGRWYFTVDGPLDITGNEALTAALETEVRLMKSGIVQVVPDWPDYAVALAKGDVATMTTGVWYTSTIKSFKGQAGLWGVAPVPALCIAGAGHVSNLGGSSWYVLDQSPEKATAIDFLNEIYGKDVDFYQSILRTRGAVGTLLAARGGKAYMAGDPFFGGDKVWQRFSDWLAKVPSVNYGIYTVEADAALTAQMPALLNGAPADQVLRKVEQQLIGQLK